MAFKAAGSYDPHGAPVLVARVLANSITVTELDSVKLASGFVALGTTGASVFGHVVGIRTNKGVGLDTTGVAGAEMGSFVGSFLTASDNQTVGFVRASVDISKLTVYSAELDATIATTTGSNLGGYYADIADEDTIDESTAATTTGQYALHGVDPNNTAQALATVFESSVFGPLS